MHSLNRFEFRKSVIIHFRAEANTCAHYSADTILYIGQFESRQRFWWLRNSQEPIWLVSVGGLIIGSKLQSGMVLQTNHFLLWFTNLLPSVGFTARTDHDAHLRWRKVHQLAISRFRQSVLGNSDRLCGAENLLSDEINQKHQTTDVLLWYYFLCQLHVDLVSIRKSSVH